MDIGGAIAGEAEKLVLRWLQLLLTHVITIVDSINVGG